MCESTISATRQKKQEVYPERICKGQNLRRTMAAFLIVLNGVAVVSAPPRRLATRFQLGLDGFRDEVLQIILIVVTPLLHSVHHAIG